MRIYEEKADHWVRVGVLIAGLFFASGENALAGNRPASPLIQKINDSWQYLEDAAPDVQRIILAQSGWQSVSLPHSWNRFDAVDPVPGYRRSASWYRRHLPSPDSLVDRRVILCFEGVNISCRLFVNGTEAGGHVGGYMGFEVDVTPFLKKGNQNWLYVWVDNSYDPDIIPSQKSDFFIYGGITRNVWMKLVPSSYVERLHIRTVDVRNESARTEVIVRTRNTGKRQVRTTVEATLLDMQGHARAIRETTVVLESGRAEVVLPLPVLRAPHLWSPDDPYLYTAVVQLKNPDGTADVVRERFGYRWFEFRERGPFFLNGKRLLLRGTHRHEDYAGLANAIPDTLQRKDMLMIKQMGANFVRLAHYPQAPEVYRACDELGILVWDELPWCRGGVGGPAWKANTRRLLQEQIDQNFNHPSIILWSLGNEVYGDFDFPGGENIDSLRSFFAELGGIAKSCDLDRPISVRKFYEVADLVDVFSPSIWMGWYSSQYNNYEKAITEAHEKYPRLLHVEYGGDSHVGRHTENPLGGDGFTTPDGWNQKFEKERISRVAINGDWSESYIVDLFDWHLHVSEQLDWFVGNAQWAFKDFGTPLRPENPIPYVNQKGLVDRAGVPKDAYYVFKSYWTTSPKFCYILSHSWDERNGPPGLRRPVRVYSNCDEVELTVNGVSLGKRKRDIRDFPSAGLRWDVEFAEGKNLIRAAGCNPGEQTAVDSLTILYSHSQPGEAQEIHISTSPIAAGGVLVTAVAVDKQGNRAINYNKRVYFSSEGDGKLMGDYGTPSGSSIIEMANGKAQIVFETVAGGRAVVEARTHELKGAFVVIASQREE